MTSIFLIIMIIFAAGTAGFAIYWYAFRFEPVNFKLSEVDILVSGSREGWKIRKANRYASKGIYLPDAVRSSSPVLTILHLSDFHLRKGRKGDRLFQFINGLKVLFPDLILITGDLVEKNEYFSYLSEMLSGFRSRLGKYAVFGVHDYYDKTAREFMTNMIKRKEVYKRENDVESLIKRLDSIGIKVLQNKTVQHNLQGPSGSFDRIVERVDKKIVDAYEGNISRCRINEVQIIGLEDIIIEKTDIGLAFKGLAADYKKGLESTGSKINCFKPSTDRCHTLNNSSRLRICITHTPDRDLLAELARREADIILCGHTHGGQVRLPGVGALFTGSRIKARYASGLFYLRDFVLYTSRGLGEGRYSPFRFYCQPEASLLRVYCC